MMLGGEEPAAPAAAEAPAPPQEDCGVKGMVNLSQYFDKSGCECLNEADDHPWAHAMTSGGGFLESDCDEQLILNMAFSQGVKIHSLKIKAPEGKGPKTIKIFQNLPNSLDFDKAEGMESTQEFTLKPEQLDGNPIGLRFVKFQNVTNFQIFVKDNQEGGEVTQIDYLAIIGQTIDTTNMSEFKRVAGKKGEGH